MHTPQSTNSVASVHRVVSSSPSDNAVTVVSKNDEDNDDRDDDESDDNGVEVNPNLEGGRCFHSTSSTSSRPLTHIGGKVVEQATLQFSTIHLLTLPIVIPSTAAANNIAVN
ncbi:unnamed protein product [Hydatigera taeniaeformis]|uniref:Uncharacterized protein n=1 Tax=Hydatigena taeniaeformis TaxID=6205 RepID=A0A3P7F8L1_HYDTA|nr:unnamed protein product [Hydatigera taeniaeformis]